jgi:hypothetical protein
MDIQNINSAVQSAKTTRQETTDSQSAGFQSYLDAFSEKIQNEPSSIKPYPQVCNVQEVPFINIQSQNGEMFDKVHSVLNLFEDYSKDLQNPNKTLKEIEPALMNMKQAAEKLYKENALNAEANQSLSQMINNLQVTASVEYFKFQRGDYI